MVVWGEVSFWFYDRTGNMWGWYVGAYDQAGQMLGHTYLDVAPRYLWHMEIDHENELVMTYGQGSSTAPVSWDTLRDLVPGPSVTLTVSPNPVDIDGQVSLQAQLAALPPDPGGEVWFSANESTELGSAAVTSEGLASVTVAASDLGTGTHAVLARYTPPADSELDEIESLPVQLVVLDSYAVTFLDWDDAVLHQQQVGEGQAATAPDAPERTGYTFTGWDVGFSEVTEDLTVRAQYVANAYEVSFDAAGGEVDPATQTKVFDATYGVGADGETAESLPIPSRAGYHFVGWFTEPEGDGVQVGDEATVATAADHTLYAHWTLDPVIARLELTASASTVDQGDTVTLDVEGFNAGGERLGDVAGDVVLSSDVASDVIDGLTVTFPTASPHTITATHTPTETTAQIVIEVVPPAVDGAEEAGETESASAMIPPTGGPSTGWLLAGLVVIGLGALVLVGARRHRR